MARACIISPRHRPPDSATTEGGQVSAQRHVLGRYGLSGRLKNPLPAGAINPMLLNDCGHAPGRRKHSINLAPNQRMVRIATGVLDLHPNAVGCDESRENRFVLSNV